MKRTQIQLPDALYVSAKGLADQKEISLAELVRRGLEYLISVSPEASPEWSLPAGRDLGGNDPFASESWRTELHMDRLRVAESGEEYGDTE